MTKNNEYSVRHTRQAASRQPVIYNQQMNRCAPDIVPQP